MFWEPDRASMARERHLCASNLLHTNTTKTRLSFRTQSKEMRGRRPRGNCHLEKVFMFDTEEGTCLQRQFQDPFVLVPLPTDALVTAFPLSPNRSAGTVNEAQPWKKCGYTQLHAILRLFFNPRSFARRWPTAVPDLGAINNTETIHMGDRDSGWSEPFRFDMSKRGLLFHVDLSPPQIVEVVS